MDEEEGWTPNPLVYTKDSEETSVLDKNGKPFSIQRREPIGFKLYKNRGNKTT